MLEYCLFADMGMCNLVPALLWSLRLVLELRYLTITTCLGSHDTVVKYLESNKSWGPGVGVVSTPTHSITLPYAQQ